MLRANRKFILKPLVFFQNANIGPSYLQISTIADLDQQRFALFDKILIANRGEIAVRVMKTARKLGIKTVAVYSEADRNAMHVQMADEAFLIGPAASSESYLNAAKIIAAAQRSGAQAIHPGYGFLSENASFAEKVTSSGLVFIGPPVQAIVDMGSKSASKNIMSNAKVPVIPGYHGDNQDPSHLKREAEKIGFPVLIKAVKGGGGKGMRIVDTIADFDVMLASAKRESLKSFGDDQVLVEKYLIKPRHVEVQVFADKLGNAVYLFERDCSVQRRHQKILEEAPAPGLTPELRKSLGEKAVAAAKAVGYVGAGTVEFILDTLTNQFYFMEMNTRLQVEHPVTEMVTGTDLVHWQLEVASGNRLPLLQNDIPLNGHAFEARIYAETPANNFLPDTGILAHLRPPATMPDGSVRVEMGVRQFDEVSVHYDPMICKLVVRGVDRKDALRLLHKNLGDFQIVGLNTNIEFLKAVVAHADFSSGDLDTGFIKRNEKTLFQQKELATPEAFLHAALGIICKEVSLIPLSSDPWSFLSHVRLQAASSRTVVLKSRVTADMEIISTVILRFDSQNDSIHATVQRGSETPIVFVNAKVASFENGTDLKLEIEGHRLTSTVVRENDNLLHVFLDGKKETFSIPTPLHLNVPTSGNEGNNQVVTPMPCKISQISVKVGQKVTAGDPLLILEAMKMEHLIRSPKDGVIKEILFKEGDIVGQNKLLVTFE